VLAAALKLPRPSGVMSPDVEARGPPKSAGLKAQGAFVLSLDAGR